MAALAQDLPRKYAPGVPGHFTTFPVKATTDIFEGSSLEMNSNSSIDEAEPLAGAGSTFIGFAHRRADNNPGAAGAIQVKVRQKGIIQDVDVTSATADSVHAAVYMANDNTLTTVSTLGTQIGKVLKWHSGTSCDVYFEGEGVRSI